MKKLLIVLLVTLITTAVGLYFRPSYPMIGQIDWFKVISKGYFVGSFAGLFSQGFIDESFWYVMRFTAGGLIGGMLLVMLTGKSSAKKKN